MKPYGQVKKVKGWKNKTDHRIHVKNRKIGNWWEEICGYLSRSAIKQLWKKEI